MKRKSTRTYSDKKMSTVQSNELQEAMSELSDQDYRFELIDFKFGDGAKIGTYGMIKGATTYIIGVMKKASVFEKVPATEFGYRFEKVILKATELGLDTCWMVASFNSKDIERLIELKSDEEVVMVSPVGFENGKRSIADRITRAIAKSSSRRAWGELFFQGSFNKALTESAAGLYRDAFEAVRIGPSAGNKQPWKIVLTDDTVDFYREDNSYTGNKKLRMDVNYNDIGIAMAHFKLVLMEQGIEGEWVVKSELKSDQYEYMVSYKI